MSTLHRSLPLALAISLVAGVASAASFIPLALTDAPSPGFNGLLFSSVGSVGISNTNTYAGSGFLIESGGQDFGLFNPTQALVLQNASEESGAVNGLASPTFHVNNSGDVAAAVRLDGDESGEQSLVVNREVVHRFGDAGPDGITIDVLQVYGVTNDGEVLFSNLLDPRGVRDGALILGDTVIVRTGDVLKDPQGAVVTEIGSAAVNDRGEVIYEIGFDLPDGTQSEAIFLGDQIIAQRGEVIEGIDDASVLFVSVADINEQGDYLYRTSLTGEGVAFVDSQVLFRNGEQLLQGGNAAPGIPGATLDRFSGPSIGADGVVSLVGTLSGEGVDASNDRGLFRFGDGLPELLLRSGDEIQFDAETRVVSNIQQFNGGMNQALFHGLRLSFTDGSRGTFIANFEKEGATTPTTQIPVPAPLALLLSSICGLAFMRRSKTNI